jgi:glycosyltransferase involved in cell wall biosynthesis
MAEYSGNQGEQASAPAPMVSVVIPTYNYGRYVVDAVKSVLAQTFHDLEVIVVDDGSKDDTRERLAPYDRQIRYIPQENAGVAAARNKGIAQARGRFIALLDADDLWHPRFLEIAMREFAREPQFTVLCCDKLTGCECHWVDFDENHYRGTEIPIEALLTRHPVGCSSIVIRRAVFDKAGPFDTSLRYVEDRDMWIRIHLAGGHIYHVELPLVWLRLHGGSMSSPDNARLMELFDQLVIRRAFDQPPLNARWRLRREALSCAAWTAAVSYRDAGSYGRAWLASLRASWLWPLPYRFGPYRRENQFRLRFVGCLLRNQLRSAFHKPQPLGN